MSSRERETDRVREGFRANGLRRLAFPCMILGKSFHFTVQFTGPRSRLAMIPLARRLTGSHRLTMDEEVKGVLFWAISR